MSSFDEDRERRIGHLVNDFMDRLANGEHVAEEDLLRGHPDIADELRSQLETLRSVARTPPPASPGLLPSIEGLAGYQLIEETGRGGMGVVYKAYQRATRRVVAVKLMREGPLAGEESRRRFAREVTVAARLQHPNIVAIHESGIDRGGYYFVMDYVEGEPLHRYAARRNLSLIDRVRLMAKICTAIGYAHSQGVVHRDLKPSNVLVDDAGEPHVVDFGLAKTLTRADETATRLTEGIHIMGTLAYMAPEQANGRSDDIDARTDVYALGVMLFELLTGRYPYAASGPVTEVIRNIIETEPTRPSRLVRPLRGDIESILLKSLAKDRLRRYADGASLAADLQRFLAAEPVDARRGSSLYVVRRRLQRYWRHAAIASVLAGIALYLTASARRVVPPAPMGADVPYDCDFSLDPGWVTDQAENYHWDGTHGAYFVRMENKQPGYRPNRYFYKQLARPVMSFTLTWEMTVIRCDWSAGVCLGLFDSNMLGASSLGGQSIFLDFSHVDGGRQIALHISSIAGLASDNSDFDGWKPGQPYECALLYDAAAAVVSCTVRDADSKRLVWESSRVPVPGGGFVNPLQRLGGSRFGMGEFDYRGVAAGARAEALIDNVSLIPEVRPLTATHSLPDAAARPPAQQGPELVTPPAPERRTSATRRRDSVFVAALEAFCCVRRGGWGAWTMSSFGS